MGKMNWLYMCSSLHIVFLSLSGFEDCSSNLDGMSAHKNTSWCRQATALSGGIAVNETTYNVREGKKQPSSKYSTAFTVTV